MELLAPAGALRELKAAVQSGADAVYIGASHFSARAGAGNFTTEEMREGIEYAHAYGVKVHCAINTLIKENEFDAAIKTAIEANECGVDALIIQDLGLASELSKILPDIELHASTQMTVTTLEGVKYLEECGFKRVVLARELSMEEIKHIADGAKAEIEVFVHGAICMCYSGQCLMSSILGGRSGNRGRCAQPCRLGYELLENGKVCDNAYVLSPKDMSLIHHLGKLREIGVSSLKIEGRLKSAEYVSATVGVYRKYLDSDMPVSKADEDELKNAFSRSGFTDGYFTNRLGKNMMSHNNPANNSGSTYTNEAKQRADGKIVRRVPVNIYASLLSDDVLRITAYDNDGNCVEVTGKNKAEIATKTPLSPQRLKDQLLKLGDSIFAADDINVEIDDGITVPIKDINEARRKMCAELFKKRAERPIKRVNARVIKQSAQGQDDELYITAEARTKAQAEALLKVGGIGRLYVPESVVKTLWSKDTKIVVKQNCDDADTKHETIVLSTGEWYKNKAMAKYGDFRLNVYNSFTANKLSQFESITLSPELNLHEIAELCKNTNVKTEIIAYGHLPLMIMKNCPIKAMGRCQNGKDLYSLRDRKNMEFPIICTDNCKAVLLNSKPIYTADITDEIKRTKVNAIRLNFTIEAPERCAEIAKEYIRALNGETIKKPEDNTFTRGHLRRGVM